jgi:hypothetical protein
MPGLVVALRADRVVYLEALSVFYAGNCISLNQGNYLAFNRLGSGVLPMIKYLLIDIE